MSKSSFNSINNSISEVNTCLKGHSVLPKSELKALDVRLQGLFTRINMLYESGYTLSHEEISSLKSLSERILQVLPKKHTLFSPGIRRAFKSIQLTTLSMRSIESGSSTAAKAVTKPAWVGILFKEGHDDEALSVLNSILDPKLKNQAYVEIVKIGKVDFVLQRLDEMSQEQLGHLIEIMNQSSKDQYIESTLCLLPGMVQGRNNINVMDLLQKIQDSKIQIKAYGQFARDGGLHSIVEEAKKMPLQEGMKLLFSVREELFASNIEPNLLKKFMLAVDVGLEQVIEKDKMSIKLASKEEESKASLEQPTFSEAIADKVRGFRKKMAGLTGLHNFFTRFSKAADDSSETLTEETVSLSSEEVDLHDEQSGEEVALPFETAKVENPNVEMKMETTERKLTPILGTTLFNILFQMIGEKEISEFSSEVKGGDIPFRFKLGEIEDKKVPSKLVKTLLKEFNVPSIVANFASVTTTFSEFMSVIRKADMEEGKMWVEFPEAKETITFKVTGVGDLGVKKVEINGINEVIVTFSPIAKEKWKEEELVANLGEQDQLAIPFWRQIWERS